MPFIREQPFGDYNDFDYEIHIPAGHPRGQSHFRTAGNHELPTVEDINGPAVMINLQRLAEARANKSERFPITPRSIQRWVERMSRNNALPKRWSDGEPVLSVWRRLLVSTLDMTEDRDIFQGKIPEYLHTIKDEALTALFEAIQKETGVTPTCIVTEDPGLIDEDCTIAGLHVGANFDLTSFSEIRGLGMAHDFFARDILFGRLSIHPAEDKQSKVLPVAGAYFYPHWVTGGKGCVTE